MTVDGQGPRDYYTTLLLSPRSDWPADEPSAIERARKDLVEHHYDRVVVVKVVAILERSSTVEITRP